MEQRPDSYFRDQLYDHEMDVTAGASFEKVMERRKKKRRFVFWWNFRNVAAVGVLFFSGVGSLVYFTTKPFIKDLNSDIAVQQNPTKTAFNPAISKQGIKSEVAHSTLKSTIVNTNEGLSSSVKSTKSVISKHTAVISFGATVAKQINPLNYKALFSLDHSWSKKKTKEKEPAEMNSISSLKKNQDKNHEIELRNSESSISYFEGYVLSSKSLTPYSKAKVRDVTSGDLNMDIDLAPRPIKLRLAPSVWFAEFSAVTGSNNTINFDDNLPLSILGTQYMAQYQAIILKDFQNGSQVGLGAQYSEWVGNGEWRKNENVAVLETDSHYVKVNLPWQPTKYKLVIDSNYKIYSNTQKGNITYKISKISFPIAYRFNTQIGKTPIRIGIHLAPGFTNEFSGVYFTNTDYKPLDTKRHATMDGKITIGPMIPLSRKWTFVIEPSLVYQSYLSEKSTVNGKFFTGLGIALLRQF